jgi:putative flippase GtrA
MKQLFKRFISTQSTRGQAARFFVVGCSAVMVDFILYRLLMLVAVPVAIAKAIGFVSGTVYSFFMNRTFTFKHDSSNKEQVVGFVFVYTFTMGMNLVMNELGLFIFGKGEIGINISFVIAAFASAAVNFIGMKKFVFKSVHTGR